MEICFKNKKLQKLCENHTKLKVKYGIVKAKRIVMRIGDLIDAVSLYDVSKLPQTGFHPLHHNRQGQFAIYTQQPYRIIFIIQNGSPDDLKSITSIEIIPINENYHQK